MRLFVALLLEPELRESLAHLQNELRRLDTSGCVRWIDPHAIHLTLKFLGEAPEADREIITTALAAAVRECPAPVLGLGRPGVFPGPNRPRVLWVGVRETGTAVQSLAATVDAAMTALGWERERRVFQPHLTVGRVRDTASPQATRLLVAAFERLRTAPVPDARHPRVALMRSHLGPSGARYEELHTWKLT